MNNNQIIKRSPSNIAIVKYWGKHGNQLPNNPSISFTLSNCFTETKVTYKENHLGITTMDFYFEGKENPAFKSKIEKFLNANEQYFTFLKGLDLKIESYNSFPHSSGIASSASSMIFNLSLRTFIGSSSFLPFLFFFIPFIASE